MGEEDGEEEFEGWREGGGDVRGKKWADMGRERWAGHRREGGAEGPIPRTPRESRNGRGRDGVVEKRKERRLGDMVEAKVSEFVERRAARRDLTSNEPCLVTSRKTHSRVQQ